MQMYSTPYLENIIICAIFQKDLVLLDPFSFTLITNAPMINVLFSD